MAVRFVKQFSGCQPFHCELLKIKIFSVPNGTLKNGQRSFRCVGQTHFTTDEKNHNAQKTRCLGAFVRNYLLPSYKYRLEVLKTCEASSP